MPLVGFKPTKARLIIEDSNDTILVMRVVVAANESVTLAGGGKLESLSGVLRIRERKEGNGRNGSHVVGSLVFIDESGEGEGRAPAKFQINIGLGAEKFKSVLRVAVAGLLPTKFYVDAGERLSRSETRGLVYGSGVGGVRIKIWDAQTYRSLPINKFSMILPIELLDHRLDPAVASAALANEDPSRELLTHENVPVESVATNAQVAELVDDLLVFQSETRNTLYALIWVVGIVAALALVFGIALVYR